MWKTLEHNGPYVQPEYKRVNGVDLLVNNKKIKTPDLAQQYIFMYCKYGGVKDEVYVTNFFNSLGEIFPEIVGLDYKTFNLKEFTRYLETYVPKKKDKEEAKRLMEIHSVCVLNGEKQTIGGYSVEPASIFKGLGDNPNRGKIKLPVKPSDITINTSIPKEKFPKPPYGSWGNIVCDKDKLYIASFRSNVTGKIKYIYLNRTSSFKTASELEKYEKARNLALIIDDIRKEYNDLLKSKTRKDRELGLAIYLIDNFAFRVGNEPSTGSGAETTGTTTLKKSNVKLLGNNKVHFTFVAKDSILYDEIQTLSSDAYKVMEEIYYNREFGGGAGAGGAATDSDTDDWIEEPAIYRGVVHGGGGGGGNGDSDSSRIFSINASLVNKWLEQKMTGLTAKVFRTYNASILVLNKLLAVDMSKFTDDKKLDEFTKVNTVIAKVCNHKKNVPKEQREKIENEIKELSSLEKPTIKQTSRLDKLKRDRITLGVALSTSKMNYIDPRLVYKWCYKNKIDPKKIYNKSLLDATAWALGSENFSYT